MRLFSIDEARALLPEVIPVLERLRDAFVALRGMRVREATGRRAAMADGNPIDLGPQIGESERSRHEASVRECAESIDGWGIQLKDPERGLIDFPHEMDGEVVLLCFDLGDDGLDWWHPIETGYAGRRRIGE